MQFWLSSSQQRPLSWPHQSANKKEIPKLVTDIEAQESDINDAQQAVATPPLLKICKALEASEQPCRLRVPNGNLVVGKPLPKEEVTQSNVSDLAQVRTRMRQHKLYKFSNPTEGIDSHQQPQQIKQADFVADQFASLGRPCGIWRKKRGQQHFLSALTQC